MYVGYRLVLEMMSAGTENYVVFVYGFLLNKIYCLRAPELSALKQKPQNILEML